jgi:hypothetical protein
MTSRPLRSTEGDQPQVNMKGPFAITQVNESIAREQQGLGPFVHKKRKAKRQAAEAEIAAEGGEPARHFKLLSLSECRDRRPVCKWS